MKRDASSGFGGSGGSGWLLSLVFSILLSLVLGLTLVWLSIESTDMAYSIGQLSLGL
jgi:hypothetical protein